MCFTVLLRSWVLLHGARLAAAATAGQTAPRADPHTTLFGVSLYIVREGGEKAEVSWSLDVLRSFLQNGDSLDSCKNDTKRPCLIATQCPNKIKWNTTEIQHDNLNQCFQLIDENSTNIYEEDLNPDKPLYVEVWGYGLLSVGIISLSGLFGGLFWPLMSSKYYDHVMRTLIGLAVGTLSATSTMQLIPQGFGMKETDVETYLPISLIMLSSIWILYMFEICCKIYFHSTNEPEKCKEISTKVNRTVTDESYKKSVEDVGLLPIIVTDSTHRRSSLKPYISSTSSLNKVVIMNERRLSRRHSSIHAHHIQMGGMAPVAWMVILGDGLHNFVDGMSIGAGFTNSLATGISISIAIACEEFPHELGDFAILINSGVPVKRALLYNFLSALTAVAGLVLGILLGELEASTYIFTFSGGLFLYISLTDLLPELNGMIEEGLKSAKKTACLILFQQNCGIIFGFCLLYFLSSNPVFVP